MNARAGDTRAALKAVATSLVRKDLAKNVQVFHPDLLSN